MRSGMTPVARAVFLFLSGWLALAELMSKQGMTPAGGTPEELHDLIRSDFERWNRIVREANIRAD